MKRFVVLSCLRLWVISVSYTLSLLIIILASFTSCQKGVLDSGIGRQILALNPSTNSQVSCIVYRLEDSYHRSYEAKKEKYLHGYTILSGPIDLGIEDRKDLHSIIEKKKLTLNMQYLLIVLFYRV